jgi:hypothetical protein
LAVDNTIKCLGGDALLGKSAELKSITWKWKKDYDFLNNKLSTVDWSRAQLQKVFDFRKLN